MNEDSATGVTVEFRITGDGSHTLFVPGLDENYHSVYGAIAESRHIFIEAGFKHVYRPPGKVSILEIGFGTGLNALLTVMGSELSGCRVHYTAIELNPLPHSIYPQLNYPEILHCPACRPLFMQLHESPWGLGYSLTKEFSFFKLITSLESYTPEKETFDLVYFDAFGPDVQPEMWTGEVFEKMAYGLKQGGVLVTYSTKGTVKRNLKNAGFSIEKLPGPEGKREILRATRI